MERHYLEQEETKRGEKRREIEGVEREETAEKHFII